VDAPGAARREDAAVLALLAGTGLAHLFDGPGVFPLVVHDRAAAVTDALEIAGRSGAGRLVVLPNDEDLAGVAAEIADRARAVGIEVIVIPTRSAMQGLAAVAVHDDERRTDDDTVAMAEAAAATRFAQIEIATGPGLTTIGACAAGDVLGLIDGDVVEIGSGVTAVAISVLTRLLGIGGELVTAVIGPGAPSGLEAALRERVSERAPLTELVVYAGEQRDGVLLLGME
jgi:dihydroxyacetone kinase-like predicted kinase